MRASLRRGAVYVILASGMVPHTSLVTFVRCSSRVRGVVCNILARLSPYPYLVVCCLSWRRCTPFTNERVGAGAVPPTLLFGLVLVHTFVGVGPCVHVCVLLFAVARFTSYLRPAWFHTPLWLPLFVVLLACAAWYVTYLRDSLLTRILLCVACLGAVVLPFQASVRGRGFFLLHSSLGRPWFTPSLS